jgi:hypothetical protein
MTQTTFGVDEIAVGLEEIGNEIGLDEFGAKSMTHTTFGADEIGPAAISRTELGPEEIGPEAVTRTKFGPAINHVGAEAINQMAQIKQMMCPGEIGSAAMIRTAIGPEEIGNELPQIGWPKLDGPDWLAHIGWPKSVGPNEVCFQSATQQFQNRVEICTEGNITKINQIMIIAATFEENTATDIDQFNTKILHGKRIAGKHILAVFNESILHAQTMSTFLLRVFVNIAITSTRDIRHIDVGDMPLGGTRL